MDIFYPELRYERVIHQAAFEPLSLASEVGGLLGLLVGCSVITLVEFLDYGFSKLGGMMAAWARRKRTAEDREQGV